MRRSMGAPSSGSYLTRGRVWAAAATIAGALGCGEARVLDDSVVVTLSDATSCSPTAGVARIRVRALGDAPEGAEVALVPDGPSAVLPSPTFPVIALLASAEGPRWRAIGYREVGDRGDDLLLLPPGLSCGLADPEARAPVGAAIAVAPEGMLVVAGGLGTDDIAVRRVLTLDPGALRADMDSLELGTAAAFASATALDDGRILVAGGAIDEDASPYDTYQEIDPSDGESRVVGSLADRRRDHSAIALRDGRVLVVGGRGADSVALASIEIIDRQARRGSRARTSLAIARVAPTLALDERGRVWIAGGEVGSEIVIERFDPDAETIERHDLALPRAEALAFLPGGRLAWIAGGRMFLVIVREEVVAIEPRTAGTLVAEARAIATPGGRVLIVGRGAAALRDPGRGTEIPRETSVAPSAIAVLGDRSLIELSPTGAAHRREDEPTPYEDPPATLLFALDDAWLLLDPTDRETDPEPAWLAPRFEQQGSDLVALVAGARADVRALRASRMDVIVRGEGALELLLVRDDAPEIVIGLDESTVRIGDCRLPHTDEPIAVDPERITVGVRSCAIEGAGPFGIALRAGEVGARLASIAIARR